MGILGKKSKIIIVIFGIIVIALSLLWYKTWYIFLALLIYGFILLLSGINYRSKKSWFLIALVMTVPWAGLIYFQFLRRVFYWFVHGGEAPNGMGSPVAFLIGWLFELPFVIGISIVCYALYKDILLEKRKLIIAPNEKSVED